MLKQPKFTLAENDAVYTFGGEVFITIIKNGIEAIRGSLAQQHLTNTLIKLMCNFEPLQRFAVFCP